MTIRNLGDPILRLPEVEARFDQNRSLQKNRIDSHSLQKMDERLKTRLEYQRSKTWLDHTVPVQVPAEQERERSKCFASVSAVLRVTQGHGNHSPAGYENSGSIRSFLGWYSTTRTLSRPATNNNIMYVHQTCAGRQWAFFRFVPSFLDSMSLLCPRIPSH